VISASTRHLTVSTVDLATYGSALRRHWRMCVALGLVGLTLGGLLAAAIPATYTATAKVFAPAVPAHVTLDLGQARANSRPPREWTQDTEAELLRSTAVLDPAARRLGDSWTAVDLAPRIHLAVPTSTRVFLVSFTAEDAETARRGAQIVAEEFVRERSTLLTRRAQRITAALRDRRSQLQTRLSDESATSRARARLRNQIARIDKALQEVAASSANPARVVENPDPPRQPVRGNVEVPPVSGLMTGLLAGVAVGWLRDRRHPYVRDADDVAQVTNLPVLAHVDDHFLQAGFGSRTGITALAALLRRAAPVDGLRVLVTGWCPDDVLTLVAEQLRRALVAVSSDSAEATDVERAATTLDGASTGAVAVVSCRAGSATMVRRAGEADVVLLVAELARGVRHDLARTARILRRTGALAGVVTLATTRIAATFSSAPQRSSEQSSPDPSGSPPSPAPATPAEPPADQTMTGSAAP
jgi:capsular polysaccharide biosynthesis protein